ncbi:YncE family protein [Bdellovibrio bacteriovorus]|uniref:YncE family protein n=1 Tax=Bdellovibrio bacteriovorus TaxID=959 RepID=UPI0035A5B116
MRFSLFISLVLLCTNTYARAPLLEDSFTKDFLLGTAPTGCMPKGMKVEPTGRFLYVAEMCGKIDPSIKQRVPTTSIFNLQKRALEKTVVTPVGIKGGIFANTEVDFSVDGKWAFISRAEGDKTSEIFLDGGLLTVVNTVTQKIAKYIPTKGAGSKIIAARPFVKESPGEQIIYVANYFSDDVSIIDVSKLRDDGNLDGSAHYIGKIRLKTNFTNPNIKKYLIAPRGIAFTPDGKYALILATETGSLIIVDAVHHKQIAELAPMDLATAGRAVNLRHVVVSKDGRTAYFSHMRGNAISRINMKKLMEEVLTVTTTSTPVLASTTWKNLLIPFHTRDGRKNLLVLEDYPKDHPNFPNQKWELAHPNTIALDPVHNRYLYVSSRTTTSLEDSRVDPKIKGKIDIIDVRNGQLVFSLVGGSQPTALEVSPDGKTLMSAGLKDDQVYFFDLKKILSIYEYQISTKASHQ